jgi:exosortase A
MQSKAANGYWIIYSGARAYLDFQAYLRKPEDMTKSVVFRLLCLTFVLWAALFYGSIESTVAIWLRSETFTHCFIILPICIYLIKLKWSALNAAKIAPNFWILLPLLGVLMLWLLGDLAKLLVIEQGAAFLMLPLMIWLFLGNQVARILIFTFAFWMFSVPAGEFLVPQLQNLTADITVWSLQMTGVPVYREGLYLAVPNGLFEVAVACSGIRYLIASFTLGTLFAYLNYQSNKKRLIFVLFSLALPLLANGIRAYGIVMIAHLSDMKYATGVDHLIYGWMFFGLVIFVMFAVGSIWSDPVPALEPANSNQTAVLIPKVNLVMSVAALSVLVGSTFTYKHLVMNPQSNFTPDIAAVFANSQTLRDSSWIPIFENADLEVTGSSEGLDYFVAYYSVNEQGKELINSNNKLFNFKQWSIERKGQQDQFNTISITNSSGQKRLLAYTYTTPWFTSASALRIKLAQAVDALTGQSQLGLFVMLSMPIEHDIQDRQKLLDAAALRLNNSLQDVLNEQR